MSAVAIPEPIKALAERRAGGVRLIELLSICGWNVVIRQHPAGGLEAVATRGFAKETATGMSLGELACGVFIACMRSRVRPHPAYEEEPPQ